MAGKICFIYNIHMLYKSMIFTHVDASQCMMPA